MMRDSIVQISRMMMMIIIMMSQIPSIMSELGVAGTRDQDEEADLGCRLFYFYVFLWTWRRVLFTFFYFNYLSFLIYYKGHGNNFICKMENVTKQICTTITKTNTNTYNKKHLATVERAVRGWGSRCKCFLKCCKLHMGPRLNA
jgi:hypothetical protein